jgi:uncharacterized SAM-binding protein YcdF (DUF218 family)
MFFHFAKGFWFVAHPLHFVTFALLLAVLSCMLGWRRLQQASFAMAALVMIVAVASPSGPILLQTLEDRFPRPNLTPDTQVAGIVVLGGAFDLPVVAARGGYELAEAADRMVEAAILADRYPAAKVLISGGWGQFLGTADGDAAVAPRLLELLGVSAGRLVLETRSRDSYENALFAKELANPQPGETWLLVTSAFHMPRATAVFRKVGFEIVPWPTDYRTTGREGLSLFPVGGMDKFATATREWIGLFAYWLAGRIDSPFPSEAASQNR